MTIQDMREALDRHCESTSCRECPLVSVVGSCYSNVSDEILKAHYEMVFGKLAPDNVNHPSHYQGKYECIDEMITLFGVEAVKAFCKCNVYKYRFRAASKNGQEDLEKAEWYMTKLMELEGGSDD